jgi:hypothetical protein
MIRVADYLAGVFYSWLGGYGAPTPVPVIPNRYRISPNNVPIDKKKIISYLSLYRIKLIGYSEFGSGTHYHLDSYFLWLVHPTSTCTPYVRKRTMQLWDM